MSQRAGRAGHPPPPGDVRQMVTTDRNRAVVLAYVAAFNRGDVRALRQLFTPDAVVSGVLGGGGLDVAEPIWRELHDCFAVHLTVEAMLAAGDEVAVRYLERGTSRRPFRGQAATGRSYEITAMEWFLFREGLIHRRWGARDAAAQFRQMGLTPG